MRELETDYGKARSLGGSVSVNGTGVLCEMFRQAGHRVSRLRRLSPRLEQFDTIVWFPDDFDLPNEEQRDRLETWLLNRPDRTLIYVGRDYDAEADYWRQVRPSVAPKQFAEIGQRQARAQLRHDKRRMDMPQEECGVWFTARRDRPRVEATTATDWRGPWAKGLDPSKLSMRLDGRLDPPKSSDPGASDVELPTCQVLLAAGDDVFAYRAEYAGTLIVVANGSWLLNVPLVNHEHRKLADRLIAECRGKNVAFLESDAGGPPVSDSDRVKHPTGLEMFTTWPLGLILMHLMALGVLACVTAFPIFGRPRPLDPVERSDFGRHIAALGDLLERTRDRPSAVQRLQHYRQLIARESGRTAKES